MTYITKSSTFKVGKFVCLVSLSCAVALCFLTRDCACADCPDGLHRSFVAQPSHRSGVLYKVPYRIVSEGGLATPFPLLTTQAHMAHGSTLAHCSGVGYTHGDTFPVCVCTDSSHVFRTTALLPTPARTFINLTARVDSHACSFCVRSAASTVCSRVCVDSLLSHTVVVVATSLPCATTNVCRRAAASEAIERARHRDGPAPSHPCK